MIRVATRGSPLALIQAKLAADALAARHPAEEFGLQPLTTRGDRDRAARLTEATQEGVFVKELEEALREGRADLAVHSAKDLPTTASEDLVLAAFLPRGDARDVLIGRTPVALATLPSGARVGTGSPRRAAQLKAVRPDLAVVPIRGNVDTRLRRLQEGMVDAVVLAAAGLERLGRLSEVHQTLGFDVMLPAPGQGALALQAVVGSHAARLAADLDDPPTRRAVEAERAVLRGLGGGCLTPVAVHAAVSGSELAMDAAVLSSDGSRSVRAQAQGSRDADVVAAVLARLREQGADALLREDRHPRAPLLGERVLVTRAREQAGEFVRALEAAGATVIELPTISIEPLPADGRGLPEITGYDWLVFTSANAVDHFFALLDEDRRGGLAGVRTAAIGPQTAARMRTNGLAVDLVPERFVAEDLAAAFPAGTMTGKRILLPRAAGAREALPELLRAQGAVVDVLELYQVVPPAGLPAQLKAQLEEGVDIVTFTSSSTVRNFVEALGSGGLPTGVRVACIGPIAAETARRAGLRVDIIAQEYTTRGLVEALVRDRLAAIP